ncbi:MAG: hypothetical protein OXI63_13015 [Candidatus Poribacteria bacterium]|nr:hypothetical protein [Candidatus Poribacteria bacterium]
MEPRFTRGEYWLLENVVEDEFAIGALFRTESEFFNIKGHGLTRASLGETLYRLLSSGLIYAENEVDGFISTSEEIERALNEPKSRGYAPFDDQKPTSYGLTEEGGAQWEAFAAPDWRVYIKDGFHWPKGSKYGMWEVICADKQQLRSYYRSFCFYRQVEVSLESMEWDYIAPWQATYWKQLEEAYRLRFHYQDKRNDEDPKPFPPPPLEDFHEILRVWR